MKAADLTPKIRRDYLDIYAPFFAAALISNATQTAANGDSDNNEVQARDASNLADAALAELITLTK